MASITHLIRGTDGEYFEPPQRSRANVERAGELLAGFPTTWGWRKI
jgi:hypothetical protein